MGISNKIKEFINDSKEKKRVYDDNRYKAEVDELARLKEENKGVIERNKVKAELKQEKQTRFNNSSVGRAKAKFIEIDRKVKARNMKKGSNNRMNDKPMFNSAFSLGNDKKEKKKKSIFD